MCVCVCVCVCVCERERERERARADCMSIILLPVFLRVVYAETASSIDLDIHMLLIANAFSLKWSLRKSKKRDDIQPTPTEQTI